MENIKEKEKKLNFPLNDFYEHFQKYIKINYISSFDSDILIDKENKENFICPICFFVLKNPISCSDKKNSHSFCKECINEYLKDHNRCPTCKLNFGYKINNKIINELNNISLKCMFKNEGCNNIMPYTEYLNHINNCKYNNIKYECNIMKYNSKNKEFKKCGYISGKEKMKKHFKLCAYIKYKCILCNENVLQMNLEEHVKNKCKIGIISYPNGNKYIGEKNNDIKEGYGI